MSKIIKEAQLDFTEDEKTKLTEFIIKTPTMMKPGDKYVDTLNRIIKYLKGKEILSYYIPENPDKEKEPLLNRELQRKYLLPKSEAQRQRNEQQSKSRAIKLLTMAPKTREKERKKERKESKIKRIMMNKKMKVYSVNADTMTNKLATVYDIIQRRDLDIAMISEAGLKTRKPPEIEGYTAFRTDHENKNRGSIVYIKNMFTKVTLRIEDPKEKDVDSEIIHLRVEGEPACNIISVYLKPGMDAEEAAETHAILHRKVDTCAAKGEDCIIMGDCNAPMNPDTRTKVAAQKIITDWEKSGKVRILNDKSKPTRVPTQENYQPNCVDLAFVTPGLTEKGIKFKLDESREWTPARVAPTGKKAKNGDLIYIKTTPSDHMALEAEIHANIIKPSKTGNIPVINYNKDEGWTLYNKKSDKVAKDIRTLIKKYKDVNERQDAFKQLLHKLDIETFGIKFKKQNTTQKKGEI